MAIDYGAKRSGVAVTDTLRIAAHPLKAVLTVDLMDFIKAYLEREDVEMIILGDPVHTDGRPTYLKKEIEKFAKSIRNNFPDIQIEYHDEAYTSAEARRIILQSGVRKKKRRDKGLVDVVSAVVILQQYLKHI